MPRKMQRHPNYLGRGDTRRDFDNELRNLIVEACVPNSKGRKSVATAAAYLEINQDSLHRHCRTGYMPLFRAQQLLDHYNEYRNKELADCELIGEECPLREITIQEFVPFALYKPAGA